MKKQNYLDIFPKNVSLRLRVFVLLGLLFLISGIGILTKMPAKAQGADSNSANKTDTNKQETDTNSANKTDTNKKETPKETPKTTPPELPSIKEVKVIGVKNADNDTARAGIRDEIIVTVENLKNLKNYADCQSMDDKPVPGCSKQKIALFLDGQEIKDTYPEAINPETVLADPLKSSSSQGTVKFHLQRSANSDEVWADLLGNPPSPLSDDFFDRKNVTVSVGLKDSYALGSSFNSFTLARADKGFWFWLPVIFLGLLLLVVFLLAQRTNLLRDAGASPLGKVEGWTKKEKDKLKPYSLARCQMAFWFVLAIWAFLFIWMITGAFDTITTTTLALIGIGSGTALGAAVIDLGKDTDEELKELQRQETELHNDVKTLEAQKANPVEGADPTAIGTNLGTKHKQLAEVRQKISARAKTTEWFLLDILTDPKGGISFHRFQMFVWTIVLGILFLYSVWHRLSMPEFGGTLIALLGISAGTYLGFKIPENNSAPPAGQ